MCGEGRNLGKMREGRKKLPENRPHPTNMEIRL